jgi:hypothetical protein
MTRRKHLLLGGVALVLALAAAGGAVAFAGGGDDQMLGGSTADQPHSAALRATGGGKAGIVEPESSDPEEGRTAYGVEVTKRDGGKADVFLDKDYKLLRITSNEDG